MGGGSYTKIPKHLAKPKSPQSGGKDHGPAKLSGVGGPKPPLTPSPVSVAGAEEKITQSAPAPVVTEAGPAKKTTQPIVVDTSSLAAQDLCHCNDVRHAHPVDWKKGRSPEAGSGSSPGSGNPSAARRVKAKLAKMPKLMARCMVWTPECAKLGHYHIPFELLRRLEEVEIEKRAQDMLNLDDPDDDYYEDVPSDKGTVPKLIIVSSAAENAAAIEGTEIKEEGPAPSPEAVLPSAPPAPTPGAKSKPLQCAAEAQTPDHWESWAEADCDVASWKGPVAPHKEKEEVKDVEVAQVEPPASEIYFGPSLEGRTLHTTWVTLYLTASPARGELSFTQWLLQKLPLIRQSDAVSYVQLRQDLCVEAEEVDSLLTQHYSAGWAFWHTGTFHVQNQHSSIYWLAKTYNSVRHGQIYEEMYERLKLTQEWDTSLQFTEAGMQATALSFFSHVLNHHFPVEHALWKRNELVYNNTLGYCANRYVAIWGSRLSFAGKAGVTFPFAGALGATSLNVSRSGGSR